MHSRQGGQPRAGGYRRLVPVLLLLFLVVGCGEPLATPEPVFVQASGSTAMVPLVAELAAAYGEESPLVTIEVEGTGTSFGLEALRAGEADVALASWLPSAFGEGEGWRATAIARDGLAVVVHADNPLEGLGLLQLQDLFSGRTYEWAAVVDLPAGDPLSADEVQPVSREEGSGARAAFEALVMGDQQVTPRAVLLLSPQAVADYVAATPNAVGYVSMGAVRPGVKVLKVEGVLPTPETAAGGGYPLTRELWLVSAEPVPEAVGNFVEFALLPAGQQVVGLRHGRVR